MQKTKKTFGKAKLGSGRRFANCLKQMMKKYDDIEVARKVCASIGRKAYGDKKFQALAKKGKQNAK